MISEDENLLNAAKDWLAHDDEILLVTVISTWGSSPRPIGSMLLVRNNGEYFGSVSGGCIEEDLIEKYQSNSLSTKKFSILSYGVRQLDAQKFGLPCGGQLKLFLERISSIEALSPVIRCVENNSSITRHINVKNGSVSYSQPKSNQTTSYDGIALHKVFGTSWQILLIGTNDLAQHVSTLAITLGYKVMVCDPREIANSMWIGNKVIFSSEMPDDVVENLNNKEQSIVLGLTHDPKLDDMALMQALSKNFFYVGAIGSKKTQAARRKRLKQLDLNKSQIDKLHGPIGLDIGSKSPPEIAISIMAEITKLRNQAKIPASMELELSLETA